MNCKTCIFENLPKTPQVVWFHKLKEQACAVALKMAEIYEVGILAADSGDAEMVEACKAELRKGEKIHLLLESQQRVELMKN